MGSRAMYTDRRIHGTWGFLELGLQGEERVAALRFLHSTANRVMLVTEHGKLEMVLGSGDELAFGRVGGEGTVGI